MHGRVKHQHAFGIVVERTIVVDDCLSTNIDVGILVAVADSNLLNVAVEVFLESQPIDVKIASV